MWVCLDCGEYFRYAYTTWKKVYPDSTHLDGYTFCPKCGSTNIVYIDP